MSYKVNALFITDMPRTCRDRENVCERGGVKQSDTKLTKYPKSHKEYSLRKKEKDLKIFYNDIKKGTWF